MGESVKAEELSDLLKPFQERACEAEERLSRLEAAVSSKKDSRNEDLLNVVSELQKVSLVSGNEESLKLISELQAKLEKASLEIQNLSAENRKISLENDKLKYQKLHLLRALKETDQKLESPN